MERNTQIEFGRLIIGDRFYKANDTKKTVWEKVQGDVKKTYFQTYRHFAVKADEINYINAHPVAMKATTIVIFLRNRFEG